MPARFDDRARERFGDVEGQQQRKPLPRAASAAQHARREKRERQRLQNQPRAMRCQWRKHELPQHLERDERQRTGNGKARRQWTATNS